VRIRPERVAHMIQREVADLIANRLRDPGLGSWVSVTGVEVTKDLSFARVYVSVLSDGAEREASLAALTRAAPFIRRELAHRLELREVPELRFEFDESIERGARIEGLLRKIKDGEPVDDEEGAS
jgi:ribosome-binding factor A